MIDVGMGRFFPCNAECIGGAAVGGDGGGTDDVEERTAEAAEGSGAVFGGTVLGCGEMDAAVSTFGKEGMLSSLFDGDAVRDRSRGEDRVFRCGGKGGRDPDAERGIASDDGAVGVGDCTG